MERNPEADHGREMGQLRLWQFVGAAVAVFGLWLIFDELGQKESYNFLVKAYIGGPDPQSIMVGVLMVIAGVGLNIWAAIVRRRNNDT